MLLLDDFVVDLKRVNQFGDESITSDAPTLDIIRWINKYMKAVALMFNWSWLFQSFDVSVIAGTQEITINSAIKKIIAIKAPDGGRLRKISMKEALDYHTPVEDASDNNNLGWFCDFGVDRTTGAHKIQMWGKPGVTATLTAYGTSVLTPLTVASIATPANFLPFPDEIMDCVSDLVSARISKFKGSPTWANEEKFVFDTLRIRGGEEQSDPSDNSTTPLPEYYRLKNLTRTKIR